MKDRIDHDVTQDGVDRRGFLKCMAWVGTGVLWTVNGGIVTSRAFGTDDAGAAAGREPDRNGQNGDDRESQQQQEPQADASL